MHVYLVMRTSAAGDVVDKVFTTYSKAENYVKEQTKQYSLFKYWVVQWWAE